MELDLQNELKDFGLGMFALLDEKLRIEYQFCHWLSVIEARQDRGITTKIILVGTCLDLSDGIDREESLDNLRDAFQRLEIVDLIYLPCTPPQLDSQ